MRWLLGDVDWSLGNNRIHCSSGASHHANGWLLRCRTGEEYAKRLVHRDGGDSRLPPVTTFLALFYYDSKRLTHSHVGIAGCLLVDLDQMSETSVVGGWLSFS